MAALKYWWREKRPEVISGTMAFLVRQIGRSVRFSSTGFEELPMPHILCAWHGRTFLFTTRNWGRKYGVIISHSRDGEIQTRIFESFGFEVIRGSTGRGGIRAAVEAIRLLKSGMSMAITPDGPRGPSEVVQPGVLMLAQKSGAALIPAGVSAKPRFLAKSWDRYMVPWPFARAIGFAGEPIYVPADATEEELETIRLKLESEMTRLQVLAETELGQNLEPANRPTT
jgi:lysophospholipid acyltransferase (LPLAT)-like uncharacterized protein